MSARRYYALDDCIAHPNVFADSATIQLESVEDAHDQAARSLPIVYLRGGWVIALDRVNMVCAGSRAGRRR